MGKIGWFLLTNVFLQYHIKLLFFALKITFCSNNNLSAKKTYLLQHQKINGIPEPTNLSAKETYMLQHQEIMAVLNAQASKMFPRSMIFLPFKTQLRTFFISEYEFAIIEHIAGL